MEVIVKAKEGGVVFLKQLHVSKNYNESEQLENVKIKILNMTDLQYSQCGNVLEVVTSVSWTHHTSNTHCA